MMRPMLMVHLENHIHCSTKSTTVKVLGVVWDPGEDNLQFSVADIAEVAAATEPTKRNVVSIIGRFYDPLGY